MGGRDDRGVVLITLIPCGRIFELGITNLRYIISFSHPDISPVRCYLFLKTIRKRKSETESHELVEGLVPPGINIEFTNLSTTAARRYRQQALLLHIEY